ncbi:MAG TPA: DUF748 domain-containing protein [Pseudomonadales bacterium]|nr:DUF748 domain-containing protein [Pseudomonadales bacterium]
MRILRWLTWALVVVIALGLVSLALLPTAIRFAGVWWLEQQGLKANIGEVRIGYVDAIFDVEDVSAENAAGKGFRIDRLHVDVAWKPLFDKHLHIESITLDGLRVDVVQQGDKLSSVGGLALSPADAAGTSTESSPSAWQVEVASLALQDIETCYESSAPAQHFCVRLGSVDWQGPLRVDPAKGADGLNIQGELALKAFEVDDKAHQRTLTTLAGLEVSGFSAKGVQDVVIGQIRLDGLAIYPDPADVGGLVGLDVLAVGQTVLRGDSLNIGQVDVTGLGADIRRVKDGSIQLAGYVSELLPTASKSEASAQPPAAPFEFKLASLHVTKSNPVRFSDESLSSPFEMSATVDDLSVTGIDTAHPDQPSDVHLQAAAGKYGSIELGGTAQLVSKQKTFDVKGDVKGLDLRPVSAYIEHALGYRIKSGLLNAGLKLAATSGKLDSKIDLDLRHFQLKAPTNPGKETADPDIGVPLGAALNLLRDSDDSIHLSVPVTGDVNSPVFDPSDAIRKAVAKAISVAVVNYYTPFGMLSVAKGLFNLATALRFEPALFNPGTADMTMASVKQLDKLQTMMTQRPALQLSLCGFANQGDLTAITPKQPQQPQQGSETGKANSASAAPAPDALKKLHALAQLREDAVKGRLVKQGIGADRLVECEPEFKPDGVAGVSISI